MPELDEISLHLLGGFAAVVDGAEQPASAWPTRRSVELVQLLALADGHRLVRDRVLEALWPHLDPAAGAANLRKAAHHARRALGSSAAVVLRGEVVALLPDGAVRTDLAEGLALADAALGEGDPAAASAALEALAGELLPDAPYESWVQPARTHLRATCLALLRTAGRWEEVVQREPTDEVAHQQLMRRALDAGRRAEAIRWYGRLRAALARELDVPPDPTSAALHARAVAGLVPAVPPLLGRDVALGVVDRVLDGRPGALVIRGAAGMGKTVLCAHLAERARTCGRYVLPARVGDPRPRGPVLAALEAAVAADPDALAQADPASQAVLAALSPALSVAGVRDVPVAVSRHQAAGAVHRALRALAGRRPAVLLLDDAHEADEATLDLAVQLAATVDDVLVVLSHRDVPGEHLLTRAAARLGRTGRAQQVALGALDRSAAAAVVAQAAPVGLPEDVVARIVSRGDGTPFILTELARAIDPARPGWLSPSASAAITARLVDLPPAVAAVLQRVAVTADDLDPDVIVALTGLPEASATEVLDAALDAGVLVVAGDRYAFRHDLVRQALVDQVPPHERQAIHRDAARRLTAIDADPARIARHWQAGARPGEALPWLVAAARRALAVGALVDARSHLAAALAHDPDHVEARIADAQAADLLGDAGALAAYDRALAVAPADAVGDLRAMRALAQLKLGDPVGALAAVEDARPRGVMGRLSEALTWAGAAALGAADPEIGSARAAESRRLALQAGDPEALVIASWAQAAAAHARGELHDSVMADLRETSDLPHLAVRVFDGQLCITQRFLYGARPYPAVIAFADALSAEARRLGAARGHAFGVVLRGEAELLSGRLDDAERDLAEGARLHRAIAGATGEALALQRMAEVALHRGDRRAARSLLDRALSVARTTDIGFHLLDRIHGTRIALADDPDMALALVDEAEDAVRGPLETCPGCRITYAVPAAIACARAGAVDRAAAHQEAVAWLADVVMRLPAWYAAHDEVRGHLAAATGDQRSAVRWFASAARTFEDAGQRLDRDRCGALAAGSPPTPASARG